MSAHPGPVEAYRAALAHGEVRELDLTGHDHTGVPVVATTWRGTLRDGRVLDAHGVGYGETHAEARIGAWGELAERVLMSEVVAGLPTRLATYDDLRAEVSEAGVADPLTLVLEAGTGAVHDRPLTWVPTTRWRTGETVWVPVELVAHDEATLAACTPDGAPPRLTTPITNGMGAGDTLERAVGHAIGELLQRDGDTVSFRALDQGVVLDVDTDPTPAVRRVLERLRAAGVDPVVKLAAEEPVPVVYAVGRDTDPDAHPLVLSAMGEAAHVDVDAAVHHALLELASSRARRMFAFGPVADVARLHPDYWAEELAQPLGEQEPRALAATTALAGLAPRAARDALWPVLERAERVVDPARLRRPAGSHDLADPAALLQHLLGLLADHDVLVVSTPAGSPAHAAKVVVPGLEVETLSYLRLGERVAARLLRRQADGATRGRHEPLLVGLGTPDRPSRLPVPLTAAAEERLGGAVWLDRAEVERVVGPLYGLYREPRRHAPARSGADGGAGSEASPDHVRTLRDSQDRDFSQVGVAMYLALVDCRPDAADPAEPGHRPDAPPEADLAARLDAARAALAPSQRDDDLGVTATLLAAVAHADLGAAVQP